MPAIFVPRCWIAASLLTLPVFISGCATQAVPSTPVVEPIPPVAEPEESLFIPVMRSGRYTLVELEPAASQRDLLLQVVEVALPQGIQATVGNGLRHVLKCTGWRLCEETTAVMELDALPLPAAHRYLGPMTVRDALLTLVGSAWELRVDERSRQVCFVAHDDVPDDTDADDGNGVDTAIQTFPLAGAQP